MGRWCSPDLQQEPLDNQGLLPLAAQAGTHPRRSDFARRTCEEQAGLSDNVHGRSAPRDHRWPRRDAVPQRVLASDDRVALIGRERCPIDLPALRTFDEQSRIALDVSPLALPEEEVLDYREVLVVGPGSTTAPLVIQELL